MQSDAMLTTPWVIVILQGNVDRPQERSSHQANVMSHVNSNHFSLTSRACHNPQAEMRGLITALNPSAGRGKKKADPRSVFPRRSGCNPG